MAFVSRSSTIHNSTIHNSCEHELYGLERLANLTLLSADVIADTALRIG